MHETMINLTVDGDGIATMSFDMPGRSQNVFNQESIDALKATLDKIAADDNIKGVILTSSKRDFIAGADLEMIQGLAFSDAKDDANAVEGAGELGRIFRRMETLGKPFCAALNGTALGGGYEIALACHHRIAAENAKAKIGLPEAQLGLLPGAGGTQRLPRLIGMQNSAQLLMEGKTLSVAKAHEQGLVDEVVPADKLLDAAKAWLLANPEAKQPWDDKKFKVPGGGPSHPKNTQMLMASIAMLHAKTYGNYPAGPAIMSAVYEGLQVPIDAALRIEARYFTKLLKDPVAGNMVRTMFINKGRADKLARRPEGVPKSQVKKLGMLGAGMMGAGIAYASAMVGIEVVLIDINQENAEKGKAYSEKLLGKRVARGRMTEEQAAEVLSRIVPTTDYSLLEGADYIVEAVLEDRGVKAKVTEMTEAVIPNTAVFGSNTSTLPITGLAEASSRPENFIGIHFFSPVDKMPLVEIIVGEKTSDETLAKTMDYVQQIRKTPIVVNDARGFYTSRVFGTYINEGLSMLHEGIAPAFIENVGKQTGMPVSPLALADEVAIELMHHVKEATKRDLGPDYQPPIADKVVDMMMAKGRKGKKAAAGFYDYPEGGKKHLWAGLAELFPLSDVQIDADEAKRRFLYIQALETARCFDEGVITSAADADVGAILGWGFAPYTGGPVSLIDTVGVAEFVRQCDEFASKYGDRFAVPALLREMAEKGETFHGRFA